VSRKSNLVLMVMVITAAIVAPLVLGGVYLGYYVGAQVGFSGPIMAIGLSTVGFLVAIFVVIRAITWLVAREQPKS
jgi:F0F1-type ATP synthase assembly protein I